MVKHLTNVYGRNYDKQYYLIALSSQRVLLSFAVLNLAHKLCVYVLTLEVKKGR